MCALYVLASETEHASAPSPTKADVVGGEQV
jgi:hypothetical protein